MKNYIPYNPGVLPTRESPKAGESILITVQGLPPKKKKNISCRNPKNKKYDDFVRLREAATKVMDGRAWYFGDIEVYFTLHYRGEIHWSEVHEYAGGISDTLDGSSGFTFTYLPVVYEDDRQIVSLKYSSSESESNRYELEIKFK